MSYSHVRENCGETVFSVLRVMCEEGYLKCLHDGCKGNIDRYNQLVCTETAYALAITLSWFATRLKKQTEQYKFDTIEM